MSKPSFSNIELWLFELAEGNLNEQQVEELRIFLLQHPELDVEKDVWEMAKVDPVQEVYPEAHLLEKKAPKRRYFAIGSVSLLLLMFLGCYQYYGNVSGSKNTLASTTDQEKSTQDNTTDNIFGEKVSSNAASTDSYPLGAFASSESQQEFNSMNYSPFAGIYPRPEIRFTPFSALNSSYNEIRSAFEHESQVQSTRLALSDVYARPLGTSELKTNMKDREVVLEIKKPTTIHASESTIRYKSVKRPVYSSIKSTGYHESFRSKMRKSVFKIQRMFDNPIALKNFRDPHYHVPGLTANEINFGATGTMLRTRVQTLSRMQWLGSSNEQLINTVSVDGYSYGMRGGIGVQMKHSLYNKGGINASELALCYSPKLSVNHFISVEPSLRFKMGNKLLNDSRMDGIDAVELERGNVFGYYEDGSSPTGKMLWYKDLGAGVMVNTKWFFAGVQMDNLFRHKDNIYSNQTQDPRRADRQIIATAGVDWEAKKENMTLSPYMVYISNEQVSDLWMGFNYRLNWFTIGGAISSRMEPAASIGLKFEHFTLHYNADYLTSEMSGKPALSHQLMLRFTTKPSRFGRKLLNL